MRARAIYCSAGQYTKFEGPRTHQIWDTSQPSIIRIHKGYCFTNIAWGDFYYDCQLSTTSNIVFTTLGENADKSPNDSEFYLVWNVAASKWRFYENDDTGMVIKFAETSQTNMMGGWSLFDGYGIEVSENHVMYTFWGGHSCRTGTTSYNIYGIGLCVLYNSCTLESPTTSLLHQASCYSCPYNSISPAGSDEVSDCKCNAGYYTWADGAPCSACESGKYKNYIGAGVSCSNCGWNRYAYAASTACTWCPENTYVLSEIAGSIDACTSCPPGYFHQGNVREETSPNYCTSCAVGKYFPDHATTCINCPAGKYRDAGGGTCYSCNTGSEIGTYSSEGATACQDCPIGKHPDTSASSCVYCSPGKYADTKIFSESDCLECDYGKYSISAVCVDCVDGTFANSKGSSTCSSCSAGQFVEGGYWVPDPLYGWPGYTQASCTSCPDGKTSDPSNYIYLCSVQCAVGKYAQGTPCLDCPSGTYNWFSGAAGCVSCSQNSFDHLTACQLCGGKGYKIVVDSTLVLKNHKFDPHFGNEYFVHTWGQEGYYKGYWDYEAGLTWRLRNVDPFLLSNVKIKLGFMTAYCSSNCDDYAVSSEEKTKVAWFIFSGDESNKLVHLFPTSTNTWKNSRISATQYFVDDYGGDAYFENINSAVTCQACPPGTYLGSDAFSCTPCPAGTYSSTVRATSVDTCLDCPVGTISSEAGASSCTDCQHGKYALDATVACQECPIGTYSATVRAVFDNCISCEAGKFGGDTGLTTCRSCPRGQFQNDTAQSACLHCPANMYANEYGLLACKPCKDCSGIANTTTNGCTKKVGPGNCKCYDNYLWVEDYSRCIDACDAEIEQNYYLDERYVGHCET